MARNVGPEDRIVQIVVALGLALLIYLGILGGTAAIIAEIVAAYLLVTGLLFAVRHLQINRGGHERPGTALFDDRRAVRSLVRRASAAAAVSAFKPLSETPLIAKRIKENI